MEKKIVFVRFEISSQTKIIKNNNKNKKLLI